MPNDEIHFAFKMKAHGTRKSECKDCYNAKKRKRFAENEKVRQSYAIRQIKRRDRSREIVISYLREHPCVDCGESDGIVLEFDHVRGKKEYNISYMISHKTSDKTLVDEIAKCDVVCANCHRRRTASRAGWDRHYS